VEAYISMLWHRVTLVDYVTDGACSAVDPILLRCANKINHRQRPIHL